jgi:hypothetical protein
MKWTFTQSMAALEMIPACKWLRLSGMIARIRMPKLHRIDDGEVIYALELGIFRSAQCTAAHPTKSSHGDGVERAAKSLEALALQDHSFSGRTQALWVFLLKHGKETRPPHEPLTANQWRMHRSAQGRKARRRHRVHPHSSVVLCSDKNRRRAF